MRSLILRSVALSVGLLLFSATSAAAFAGPTNAGVTLVTDRATLGGNDSVDWGLLGSHSQALSNPVPHTSNGGLGLTVSQATGATHTFCTGPGLGVYDFADGDKVIDTRGGGPLTIEFATPIRGAGSQIQTPFFATVNGSIEVYDDNDVLIASFVIPVSNDLQIDDSAPFFGVLSSSDNIKRLVYDTNGYLGGPEPPTDHFPALNQMELVVAMQSVPALSMWGTLGLVATLLASAAIRLRTAGIQGTR